MNCALCIELTLFGCKFTQKIRIGILFLQKTHSLHLFFIEIQHKTHSISNSPNMHTFSKFVQSIKSKATKSTYFFLKLPKSTTFYTSRDARLVRPIGIQTKNLDSEASNSPRKSNKKKIPIVTIVAIVSIYPYNFYFPHSPSPEFQV